MVDSTVARISGPVVVAKDLDGAHLFDIVRIGEMGLVGEIIRLEGNSAMVQVYEDTTGLKPGEKVVNTNKPLSLQLGPGLLTSIYDGIQRPLDVLREESGDFISRGKVIPALDQTKKWDFIPTKKNGDQVEPGDIIGEVQETPLIKHKIMVSHNTSGTLADISEGQFNVNETVASVKNGKSTDIGLSSWWTVRIPRPVLRKLPPEEPLLTGQRVIDTFFPIAKGGTAAIPGPFGSGKTVTQQQLAKWADSDIIVYVGCGERGNEMCDVLSSFPKLEDPKTKRPLMERTILVANTSNMPVAAREASIYTGITMGEYYRDMGYGVALMADSTSRWAEALREISGRLEEMPGEEGYPAYLGRRLAEFYERGGKSIVISPENRQGSLSIVGAVSPPGGDFSEPVSQNTLRVTRVFWGLDASLASRRHFPSINWLTSYSLYVDDLADWYRSNVSKDWIDNRTAALDILQKESELQEIVQLVGYDALPEPEKGILDTARSIRENYLQQNSFDEVDTYSSIKKQSEMLSIILEFGKKEDGIIKKGITAAKVSSLESRKMIPKMKWTKDDELEQLLGNIKSTMKNEFDNLSMEASSND